MAQVVKFILGMAVFGVWGPYLIYAWMVPSEVPQWVQTGMLRKAFMLDRYFEPTFFTLMFGIMFTGIALFGLVAVLSGKRKLN